MDCVSLVCRTTEKRDSVQPSLIRSGPHDLVGTRNVNFSAFCFIFNFRESPLHCFCAALRSKDQQREEKSFLRLISPLHGFSVAWQRLHCLLDCMHLLNLLCSREIKNRSQIRRRANFSSFKAIAVGWMANF